MSDGGEAGAARDAALAEFCRREHPRLVGALSLYCGDPGVAEELAQEALIRAADRWAQVGQMAAPGAWVHRVAMNLCGSWFRRKRADRRAIARVGAERPYPPAGVDGDAVAVREAVARLPVRHRRVVVLRVVGWCASSRTFDDFWHGSQWDARGNYLTGPAPTGLATYTIHRDGETVRVGDRNPSAGRSPESGEPTPTWAGPSCAGPDPSRTREGSVTFPDLAAAPLPVRRPEDLGDDGRIITEGIIAQRGDRPVRMCTTTEGEPPACPPGSPRVVDMEPVAGPFTVTERFLARVSDGALHDVIRFPDAVGDAARSGGSRP